jgi:RNA polymerase sigma-B factor
MAARHAQDAGGVFDLTGSADAWREDLEVLMVRYAATRAPDLQERVAAAGAPVVRGIAGEFAYYGIPFEDLVQVGYVGLLKAMAAFDPTRGTRFVVYAGHLIRGEIRHHVRDLRDTIRKPRWLYRMHTQIEDGVDQYVAREGRFPGLSALAAEIGVEEADLVEVLRTRDAVKTVSLDAGDADADTGAFTPTSRHQVAARDGLPLEDRTELLLAMEALPALQRKVVYYVFFTDLTQADAARRLGVSQKHVSRVLAAALRSLRGLMSEPQPR